MRAEIYNSKQLILLTEVNEPIQVEWDKSKFNTAWIYGDLFQGSHDGIAVQHAGLYQAEMSIRMEFLSQSDISNLVIAFRFTVNNKPPGKWIKTKPGETDIIKYFENVYINSGDILGVSASMVNGDSIDINLYPGVSYVRVKSLNSFQ